MNKAILDIYSDYLICSFTNTTATGLATALDGALTHDQVTRFLSGGDYGSRDLWKLVKPTVRRLQSDEAVLIFDDTIEEKPYSDESELICTHFNHVTGSYVKGINILSCLYHSSGVNIPVAIQPIAKLDGYTGAKKTPSGVKRKCATTKNQYYLEMLSTCVFQNHLKFKYVVSDIWYAATDNMEYIKLKAKKDFVMPIKSNRLIAQSKALKYQGQWQGVGSMKLEAGKTYPVWIKGLSFQVNLVQQVFENKDGSRGILYLVCSDLDQKADQVIDIYHKRWNIEPSYKSIKENLGLAKSPTKVATTQGNHIFACFYAYFKLERLKVATGLNHFALKSKLYLKALQASMVELQFIKEQSGQVVKPVPV